MQMNHLVLFSTILLISVFTNSSPVDVLRGEQIIKDGSTIVSAEGEFELGFFSPGSSTKRYVGIWFKKISSGTRTTVWVANRDAPLNNTSGVLKIDSKAISLFSNASSTVIWSSSYSRPVDSPVAQLLDSGNLVIRDEDDGGLENSVWQSFDYPADTILPGMKFGTDLVRGLRWEHSSYKSADDPSAGSFVHRIDIHGFPQFLLWKGSELHARNGPWVGNRFSGDPEPKTNNIYMNEFVIEAMEIYYAFHLLNKSSTTPITRLTLTPNGKYTASGME
ncbi:G-type lectin S-receptor-like serine/threonine-protein kinase At4g27290 [Daucus carota subsp. sativus]|uniref:G-type lectin S-receptor-like serine/threonine-protein kinase At4g27290 n=1 Tax=Daucus carota subsp. sativus TaxID=79200 RepID=UPI0007EF766F|nr:PREDICTED: G-type lectin S-receptor-like serine/threonine-protein kinase At4g27290 [Daucus carota subsp. sativus]